MKHYSMHIKPQTELSAPGQFFVVE